jgi:hypothetical protein
VQNPCPGSEKPLPTAEKHLITFSRGTPQPIPKSKIISRGRPNEIAAFFAIKIDFHPRHG